MHCVFLLFYDAFDSSLGTKLSLCQPCSTAKQECLLICALATNWHEQKLSLLEQWTKLANIHLALKKTPQRCSYLTLKLPRQPQLHHGLLFIKANYFQGLTRSSE